MVDVNKAELRLPANYVNFLCHFRNNLPPLLFALGLKTFAIVIYYKVINLTSNLSPSESGTTVLTYTVVINFQRISAYRTSASDLACFWLPAASLTPGNFQAGQRQRTTWGNSDHITRPKIKWQTKKKQTKKSVTEVLIRTKMTVTHKPLHELLSRFRFFLSPHTESYVYISLSSMYCIANYAPSTTCVSRLIQSTPISSQLKLHFDNAAAAFILSFYVDQWLMRLPAQYSYHRKFSISWATISQFHRPLSAYHEYGLW